MRTITDEILFLHLTFTGTWSATVNLLQQLASADCNCQSMLCASFLVAFLCRRSIFFVAGLCLWNSFPFDFRWSDLAVVQFRQSLRTFLFDWQTIHFETPAWQCLCDLNVLQICLYLHSYWLFYTIWLVRYARKNGYPVLDNVTLPRIGAIETILKELSPLSSVAVVNGMHYWLSW